MKSIDTYLCKEKKETYKFCARPAIVTYDDRTRQAIEDWHKKQDEFNEQRRSKRESSNGNWSLGILSSWWPF